MINMLKFINAKWGPECQPVNRLKPLEIAFGPESHSVIASVLEAPEFYEALAERDEYFCELLCESEN